MRQIAAGLFISPLTLTSSEAFGTGVVHLTYEPAR
jgi:hypothetical protein